MLNIIWLILKIIGILLIVLFGLLVTIGLLILLVPIRYKAAGLKNEESLFLEVRAAWLFHIVSVYFRLNNKDKLIKLKVFGIALYDSRRKKKDRKRHKAKKKKHTDKDKPKDKKTELSEDDIEDVRELEKTTETVEIKTISENIKDKEKTANKVGDENIEDKEDIEEDEINENTILKNIKLKIEKVLDKVKGISENIDKLKQKYNEIKEQFFTEERKKLYASSFKLILKIIKHVLPRRIKGKIIFGTGDPYTTGQVFSYLGMIYCLYGKYTDISADFEEKRLEADIKIKGHIRFITLVVLALRIFNKDLRRLIKELKVVHKLN